MRLDVKMLQKPVIVVTATHARKEQQDYLIRLGRLLVESSNDVQIHWIVVEDSKEVTQQVSAIMNRFRLSSGSLKIDHLSFGPTNSIGHAQKALAIRFIRNRNLQGNVMFFDDDNYACVEHFIRCSQVKDVGVWRVNNVSIRGMEGPVVEKGKVVAFDGGFKSRLFAIDTAGFAVSASHLSKVSDSFLNSNQGYNWETLFLEQMFDTRGVLESFDYGKTCYISHNERLGGQCEIAWNSGDQPLVYAIDWSTRGMADIASSKVLGQFRTLATSLSYAKMMLLEAINFRFNHNKYTNAHITTPVDLNKVDILNVNFWANEDLNSWE